MRSTYGKITYTYCMYAIGKINVRNVRIRSQLGFGDYALYKSTFYLLTYIVLNGNWNFEKEIFPFQFRFQSVLAKNRILGTAHLLISCNILSIAGHQSDTKKFELLFDWFLLRFVWLVTLCSARFVAVYTQFIGAAVHSQAPLYIHSVCKANAF